MRAHCPHQPLRDERFHDRRQQKRLHIHIEQTRDAADRVVRVERAEHKVPRHRRADRDLRRFEVTNLTDHDHVRILTQNVTQTFCEGEVDLRLHVDLRNPRQAIFNRFLNGNDAPLDGVDAAEEAVERG